RRAQLVRREVPLGRGAADVRRDRQRDDPAGGTAADVGGWHRAEPRAARHPPEEDVMGVHRWAIVGTGAIATRMATDLQHPDAGATHVATLSREQERAGRFNGRLRSNAGAFADVDRLVAQARPSI